MSQAVVLFGFYLNRILPFGFDLDIGLFGTDVNLINNTN